MVKTLAGTRKYTRSGGPLQGWRREEDRHRAWLAGSPRLPVVGGGNSGAAAIEASQRQIARTLGFDHVTIGKDVGGGEHSPDEREKAKEHKATKEPDGENSPPYPTSQAQTRQRRRRLKLTLPQTAAKNEWYTPAPITATARAMDNWRAPRGSMVGRLARQLTTARQSIRHPSGITETKYTFWAFESLDYR